MIGLIQTHYGLMKDGEFHGEGAFIYDDSNRGRWYGVWDNGVKRGPFTRRSASGDILQYLYYENNTDYIVEERTEYASETSMSDIESDDAGGVEAGDEVM